MDSEEIFNRIHISIHAPARGASQSVKALVAAEIISIHAPARGASKSAVFTMSKHSDFNSRPCERGFECWRYDHSSVKNFNSRPCERGFEVKDHIDFISKISIHAPARGASAKEVCTPVIPRISIHAPARGASAKKQQFWFYFLLFLFISYIFFKQNFQLSKFRRHFPYICATFTAPISRKFMYGKDRRGGWYLFQVRFRTAMVRRLLPLASFPWNQFYSDKNFLICKNG